MILKRISNWIKEFDHTTLVHIEKSLLYILVALTLVLLALETYGDIRIEENQQLRENYNQIAQDYDELSERYKNLQSENQRTLRENQRLEEAVRNLTSETEYLESAVNTYSQIPETPAISGIDYSLHGKESRFDTASQIALEHPEISVLTPTGTGSMSPGISTQSMVITTTQFNEQTLTPGTIVSYEKNQSGTNILHRIHEVKQTENGGICYIAKGDANLQTDGTCIPPENIEKLAIGVIFRETGTFKYCEEEMQYPPSSQLCPAPPTNNQTQNNTTNQ